MIIAYRRSRIRMTDSKGGPKYTEYMIQQWEDDLRNALVSLNKENAEYMRAEFRTDREKCIESLARLADDERPQKKWAHEQKTNFGVSDARYR